jgi:hypothetical protein
MHVQLLETMLSSLSGSFSASVKFIVPSFVMTTLSSILQHVSQMPQHTCFGGPREQICPGAAYLTPPTSQKVSRTLASMYFACFGSFRYGSMMKAQK